MLTYVITLFKLPILCMYLFCLKELFRSIDTAFDILITHQQVLEKNCSEVLLLSIKVAIQDIITPDFFVWFRFIFSVS